MHFFSSKCGDMGANFCLSTTYNKMDGYRWNLQLNQTFITFILQTIHNWKIICALERVTVKIICALERVTVGARYFLGLFFKVLSAFGCVYKFLSVIYIYMYICHNFFHLFALGKLK